LGITVDLYESFWKNGLIEKSYTISYHKLDRSFFNLFSEEIYIFSPLRWNHGVQRSLKHMKK